MDIEDRRFYKDVFRLVMPMAVQNLINVGVTSTDVIMLGRVGENALSGVSLANQVYFIPAVLRADLRRLCADCPVLGQKGHQDHRKSDGNVLPYFYYCRHRVCSGGYFLSPVSHADLYFRSGYYCGRSFLPENCRIFLCFVGFY